jgi:hypothetical protein
MLNSLLSHFLFGTTSNDNSIVQQQQENEQQQQTVEECLSKIEKYTDVRNDVDWVIIDPSDNDGNFIIIFTSKYI